MNRRKRRRRVAGRNTGFTLMEVLLVLAILVILGSLVVTNFSKVLESGKIKATKTQLSGFETQLDIFQLDVGQYPSSQQGLESLRVAPPDLPDPSLWAGPYAKKDIPADPWGNQYIYEQLGPSQYRVSSAGPDGQPGTDDDIGTVSG